VKFTIRIVLFCTIFATLRFSAFAEPATTEALHRLEIRLVATDTETPAADELPMLDQPEQKLRVLKHIELDDRDLESTAPSETLSSEGPSIQLTFTDAGAEKFSALTGNNIGRQVAIVFDGKILSAPTIRSRIGRKGVISFGRNTTPEEAKNLIDTLNQMIDERAPATKPAER
jgi:preprotein translocase subunit SecD